MQAHPPSPEHIRRYVRRTGIGIMLLALLGGLVWFTPPSPKDLSPPSSQDSPQAWTTPDPDIQKADAARSSGSRNPSLLAPSEPSGAHRPNPLSSAASSSVRFNGKTFLSDPSAASRLQELQTNLLDTQSQVVLLGFDHPLTPSQKQQLLRAGISLLAPIPDQGWVARVGSRRGQAIEQLAGVDLLQPFDSALRIRPTLRQSSTEPETPVYVHLVPDRGGTSLMKSLETAGFNELTVQVTPSHSYVAGRIANPRLESFLDLTGNHPDVQFVERGMRAQTLNQNARRTLQSGDFLGPIPFWQAGIHGSNQVIAVCDTGIDLDSCYFRDTFDRWPPTNSLTGVKVDLSQRKVIAVNFIYSGDRPDVAEGWDNQGHGTAVAGCAAGADVNALLDPDIPNGMAPGAKIIMQDAGFSGTDVCADLIGLGCPVTNYLPVLLQAQGQGALIHNNSWGDREDALDQNTYSQPSRELDQVTWQHPEFLVVCAGGNSVLSDTVGSPSVAKNSLSVAATQSGSAQERIAFFSSRGWASDGRLKPDLAAPGQSIRTSGGDGDVTTRNCTSTSVSGTSFSSPLVAGLAALVRDYFAQGFYPDGTPSVLRARPQVSAALVKGILINSTVPVLQASAAPPSRDQGWGRVNLSQSLPLSANSVRLLAIDATNGFDRLSDFPRVTYVRARSQSPLKATLTWSDYPATPGADKHLVNDLDLRVRSRAREFRGNDWENGASVQGGDFDHVNNVEQVLTTPAIHEVFELSVWNHQLVHGPQPFALVVTGDFEAIPPEEDTDQDGLPDGWELWQQGDMTLDADGDPDADGSNNRTEFAANTNPFNPTSRPLLEIESLDDAQLHLEFAVSEGRSYVVEELVLGAETQPPGPDATTWHWVARTEEWVAGNPTGEGVRQVQLSRIPTPNPSAGAEGRLYRVRISRSDAGLE
ncbi:MAG: S8 family serine peptidase [Verrucomicrobiales bacterium]|nr:S8 family serine peptidase [Verrucomicrobiales bacterium]